MIHQIQTTRRVALLLAGCLLCFGCVSASNLTKDRVSGKRGGSYYVSYCSHNELKNALTHLNGNVKFNDMHQADAVPLRIFVQLEKSDAKDVHTIDDYLKTDPLDSF